MPICRAHRIEDIGEYCLRDVRATAQRGHGLGHKLMHLALKQIATLWPDLGMRLHAQTYLEEFYKSHGFEPIGDVYLIDGLDHVEMVRPK